MQYLFLKKRRKEEEEQEEGKKVSDVQAFHDSA